MNYDTISAFGLAAGLMLVIFAAIKIAQFRRAFLVPEGYAGLLYQKGKFVKSFAPANTFVGVANSRSAWRTSAKRRCSWLVRKF